MNKTEIENKIYDLKRTIKSCVNIIRANELKNLKLKKENVCEILNKELENETL